MHPQTTEVVQEKAEEDMMDLLMKMNQRLNETEQELEKALQEKQGVSTSQPSQIAPTATTTVPPIVPASTTPSTPAEKTLPSGQTLYNNLENLFYIEHEVQHLFTVQPNFYKYTDADETLIKLQRHQFPEEQWWKCMLEIL